MARTFIYTSLALLSFAGNSVLCRLALGEQTIGAASFTLIRLLSGIIVLFAIVIFSRASTTSSTKGSWQASLMLFAYAASFSFAYLSLDTGTGALILFGSVQIAMLVVSLARGVRVRYYEWLGLTIAFSGLVYLVAPTVKTPSFFGFLLMSVSGIAWGLYTLYGKDSKRPLYDTAYNFFRTLPFILLLLPFLLLDTPLSQRGVLLAVCSGALASGLGYTLWYTALKGLSATQASVLQLLVPIIAAAGGVAFAGEVISARLVVASMLVLGGILLIIFKRPGASTSVANIKM